MHNVNLSWLADQHSDAISGGCWGANDNMDLDETDQRSDSYMFELFFSTDSLEMGATAGHLNRISQVYINRMSINIQTIRWQLLNWAEAGDEGWLEQTLNADCC